MTWGKVLEIGLKVVVALGAGLAVFKGIESATSKNEEIDAQQQQDPNSFSGMGQPANDKCADSTHRNVVIDGLQAAQNTCGKLYALTQGLVTVVQSISAFGSGNNNNYNYPPYGGGYGYYPPQQCSPGWRRVSPFILEQVPQPGQAINYNAQYPY